MTKLIQNFLLVLISSLLILIFFEIFLRIDGRYQGQANTKINASETIWTRYNNSTEYHIHPDLKNKIEIKFDKFGARESLVKKENEIMTLGFFGDSMTENRRIENKFTFTEILNQNASDGKIYNFGVDGFGLEQSFLHYLNKSKSINFDRVFYIFSTNDVRNTYELNLIDRKEIQKGQIKIINIKVPFYIIILGKMHLTYLTIEAYFKFISKTELALENFAKRFGNEFQYREFKHRAHDQYADALVNNILNDKIDEDAKSIINHFNLVLKNWQTEVDKRGGKFYVLLLPTELGNKVFNKVINIKVKNFSLPSTDSFKKLLNKSWTFSNDSHWNEYGNLAAAQSIFDKANYFQIETIFNNSDINLIEKYLGKIEEIYSFQN